MLPAEQGARGDGQVAGVEGAQRRKVALAELVEPLGLDQVLQPVLAQVTDRGLVLQEAPRRLGEDDLPAVSGSGDSRCAVDVDADVALVGDERLTGVDAHAHAEDLAFERTPCLGRRGHRVGRAAECDEEGVALGVDLDAGVARERVSQEPAVLGQ